MKPLFAPWRMEVIESYEQKKSCVFCDLAENECSANSLVLHQGRYNFVVMNKYPYSNGHLMIIPKAHRGDWTELQPEELQEMMSFSQQAIKALRKAVQCDAFNMGSNLGRIAGAGIPDHVHLHLVPRWAGDTNFMPVLAETKMISEHLEATYEKILRNWS